eukprot:1399249-Rhodomonas_salina.1
MSLRVTDVNSQRASTALISHILWRPADLLSLAGSAYPPALLLRCPGTIFLVALLALHHRVELSSLGERRLKGGSSESRAEEEYKITAHRGLPDLSCLERPCALDSSAWRCCR